MFLDHPQEKDLKEITLDDFEIQLMELVRKHGQPERLNPEDHIADDSKMVCDSLNPDNKENQGDVEKSTSAKCAKCDFPPDNGRRRLYCMCGQ